MFDAIAPTYDRLNHMLSFGLDIRWRKKAIGLLREKEGGRILDIAAGSGDVSLELLSIRPSKVVGIDFSLNMLRVFQAKIRARGAESVIEVVSGDALSLPFSDGTFDATIVAFGIRNFADRLRSLKEMHRVLAGGGLSLILELSRPTAPVLAQMYDLYARVGLPLVGRIISRHTSAYRYLPDSIAQFPDRSEFLQLIHEAGFAEARALPLTFGASTVYLGRKQNG
jgi:demethylmenaquinone methyltransferase/2-methoxy-6-polyprenyl-1,4-benzoquinol methylase